MAFWDPVAAQIALFERVRLKGRFAFSCGFLGPILSHPSFPTLSRSGIASRESKCRDIGIGDLDALVRVLRQDANE